MEFVTFEIAKKLKEKGFPQVKKNALAMYNEDGEWYSLSTSLDDFYYTFEDFDDHDCICQTISQVLKWLREEKNIAFGISPMQEMDCDYLGWCATIYKVDSDGYGLSWQEELYYDTYELAALAGIEYVLDNLI